VFRNKVRTFWLLSVGVLAVVLLAELLFPSLPYPARAWLTRQRDWLPWLAFSLFFLGGAGSATKLGEWLFPILTGVALLLGGIGLVVQEGVRVLVGLGLMLAGSALVIAGFDRPRPK